MDLTVNLKLLDQATDGINALKAKVKNFNTELVGSVKRVDAEVRKVNSRLNSFVKSFRSNYLAVTGAIVAGLVAIRKGVELIRLSARFQQQEEAFRNLSASVGADADKLIASLKRMSAQTLSTSEVMQQASRAMVLGLQPDQLPRLMEIARASARAFGEDVDFMFESIVLGIGRQSRMILDNLGIIVNSEQAYEDYAKTLKKSVDQLTDLERRQAFANAVMEQGGRIIQGVGIQSKSTLESLQSFDAFWDDFRKNTGNILIQIVRGYTAFFTFVQSGFSQVASGLATTYESLLLALQKSINTVDSLLSKLPLIENPFRGLSDSITRARFGLNKWAKDSADNAIAQEQLGNAIIAQIMGTTEQAVLSSQRLRQAVAEAEAVDEASMQSLATRIEDFVSGAKDQFNGFRGTAKFTATQIAQSFSSSLGSLGSSLKAAGEMNKEFGKAAKGVAIAQATINTAVAITKARSSAPPPLNYILAAIEAAAGAIQIATISQQKFHRGGIVTSSISGGDVPIIAQAGEGILSRQGLANLGGEPVLNELNNRGGGVGVGGVTININNPRIFSQNEIDEIADMIGDSVERELVYARGQ